MVGAGGASSVARAYLDKHEQVLRIAASDIAAVAGYHEWVDVRELFLERFLYQDLEHLLCIDAKNVNIEVEDRRQRSERLLSKAGNKDLRAVRERAGDGAAVATVQDAHALRNKARFLLREAEARGKLSAAEARELEEELRHDVNTRFGTRNENIALTVYERRSGTEVICRNERILVWPFPGSKVSGDAVPDGAIEPPAELSKGWTKKKRECRGGSKRPESSTAAADIAFASAVTRCLVRCAGRGEGDCENGHDRWRAEKEQGNGMVAVGASGEAGADPDGGTFGDGSREAMMDVDSSGSGIAAEGTTSAGEEGRGGGRAGGGGKEFQHLNGIDPGGEKRELVPGVPLPEWRESKSSIPTTTGGEAGRVAPAPASKPRGGDGSPVVLSPSPSASPPTKTNLDQNGGGVGRLWFPSSLTPRQQNTVRAVAVELGFRHDTVAEESGGVRVVVWEPSTALGPSSPSLKSASHSTTGVAAIAAEAVAATEPEREPTPTAAPPAMPPAASDSRRGSCFPLQQPGTDPLGAINAEPGGGHVSSPRGDSAGDLTAAASEQSRGGERRESRRESMAMVRLASGDMTPLLPQALVAEEMSVSDPASSPTEAESTAAITTASERDNPGSIGGADESMQSATPVASNARLRTVDIFSGDPVYAWGEGPAVTHGSSESESGTLDAPEEHADEQEWSVWSRYGQASGVPTSNVQAQALDDGSAASKEEGGGLAGLEPGSPGALGALPPGRRQCGRSEAEDSETEAFREKRRNACFLVVGAVDGVAEEVTDASEDAEVWETRKVVVEVKNRMSRAKNPPPLYDQIQLVTYMLMIGAPVGDLVQFVKTGAGPGNRNGNGKRGKPAKSQLAAAAAAMPDDVLVSRVELDCGTYRHRKHWEETILPRLYAFARMVYRFRGDDLLRWRYLLAGPEEQRQMLVECCPYLEDVITRSSNASTHQQPPLSLFPSWAGGGTAEGINGGTADRTLFGPGSDLPDTGPSSATGVPVDASSKMCAGDRTNSEGTSCSNRRPSVTTVTQGEGGGGGSGDRRKEQRMQDDSSRCASVEDSSVEDVSGSYGGGGDSSVLTVLSQKSRQGKQFLEPLSLGDISEAAAAAAAAAAKATVSGSPARKKSKGQ